MRKRNSHGMRRFSLGFTVWAALYMSAGQAGAGEPVGTSKGVLRGAVKDSIGHPLSGVQVEIQAYEGGLLTERKVAATTAADGSYSMSLMWTGGNELIAKGVRAWKHGYVRFRHKERVTIAAGATARIDFVLQRGEVLAGAVSRPMTAMDRAAGFTAADLLFILQITAPSFDETYLTEKGGRFEIYVPPGEYSIKVIDPPIVLNGVKSGTTGLALGPPKPVISEKSLGDAFDALWQHMDEHYSYFVLKGVDWPRLKNEFRPKAVRAKSLEEYVSVLDGMLSELHDMHVYIETPEGTVGNYSTPWQVNWNPKFIMRSLENAARCGNFAIVARLRGDGFGCLIITKQDAANKENVAQTISEIRKLKDVPAFIVDLRGGCAGGDERLTGMVASAFCDREVVYAKSKSRNGPRHDDFGPPSDRHLKASQFAYTKPVACLIGPKCMSSGEAFVKMMRALPHVTTIGNRTRGSSGKPQPFELLGLPVTVYYSRWVDMLPDGTPVEGAGIRPEIELDVLPSAYRDDDPAWKKAIEVLRMKVSAASRPATTSAGAAE